MLAPKRKEDLGVVTTYSRSEDAREVDINIKSDRAMDTMDLIDVVTDFLNDLISQVIKEQTKS